MRAETPLLVRPAVGSGLPSAPALQSAPCVATGSNASAEKKTSSDRPLYRPLGHAPAVLSAGDGGVLHHALCLYARQHPDNGLRVGYDAPALLFPACSAAWTCASAPCSTRQPFPPFSEQHSAVTVIGYYSNVQMHEVISYLTTTANDFLARISPKDEAAGPGMAQPSQ